MLSPHFGFGRFAAVVWAGEITGTDEIPAPPPANQML
jgi:hypothetical protein